MKSLFSLILFSFIFLFICPAQENKIDSLSQRLLVITDTKEKINTTNILASELRSTNADSAIALAQRSLLLAQRENYQFGIGSAYLCLSLANGTKSRYEISHEYALKAYSIAENLKSDSLKAYSLISISSYNYNKGNYDVAIEKALTALKLFEEREDINGILKTKVFMSQIYQLKNDTGKAESILQETILLFPQINEAKIKINTLHTLANVYGMEGRFKEALELDSIGLGICEKEKAHYLKSALYDNMGNCYMYSNRFEEAKKYFLLCLGIDSSFENKKQMSDTYLNLGTLMQLQKKYSDAETYLKHSIVLASSTGYKQGNYMAYRTLSDVFNETNQHENALAAIKMSYKIKDSIINENTESKIAELETVYQTEKKEQQLKLQQAEITKKNYLLWGLIAAVVLLLITGFSFYRKRQLQNKINFQAEVMKQQDLATKAIINAEENERKRIAADLHDGVGQMMSAAKMNLSAFENEIRFKDDAQKIYFDRLIGLVDESCKEIRSVSHQMMPNALLKNGLASAVKEFIDKIDSRIIKINLYTEGLNERLDGNTETVLYRVIQECVNNVIKHSGANNLDISLIKDNDGISATVEDNGQGFNTMDRQKIEGIGLKNIRSRVEFLKGTVDFDSSLGKGTLVAIHVPAVS
jgi:signal transduction histidine kinase